MIKTVAASPAQRRAFLAELKARVGAASPEIEEKVARILQTVRENGDRAVLDYSRQFDGWAPESLELSRPEMEKLAASCAPRFLAALERAAANIYDFHQRQKQQSRICLLYTSPSPRDP